MKLLYTVSDHWSVETGTLDWWLLSHTEGFSQ